MTPRVLRAQSNVFKWLNWKKETERSIYNVIKLRNKAKRAWNSLWNILCLINSLNYTSKLLLIYFLNQVVTTRPERRLNFNVPTYAPTCLIAPSLLQCFL